MKPHLLVFFLLSCIFHSFQFKILGVRLILTKNETAYSTVKYGKSSNFILSMRALLDVKPQVLEFKVCLPINRWFGVGIGGLKMTNTELIFFMAPTNVA
jgi:hypothetical protein